MACLTATEGPTLPSSGLCLSSSLTRSRNRLLPILLSQPEYKGKDVCVSPPRCCVDHARRLQNDIPKGLPRTGRGAEIQAERERQ